MFFSKITNFLLTRIENNDTSYDIKPAQNKQSAESTSAISKVPVDIVCASALAQASYQPKMSQREVKKQIALIDQLYPEARIRYCIPEDFYDKFDYDNAKKHIDNISYLASKNSDFGHRDAFNYGYFYSKIGLDAMDILKQRYCATGERNYRSPLDMSLSEFYPNDVIKAQQENLFDSVKVQLDEYKKIYVISEAARLNDEELSRLKETNLLAYGIPYASKNEYINNVFVNCKFNYPETAKLKFLEDLIYKSTNNSDNEIADICTKLSNIENKKILAKIIDNEFFAKDKEDDRNFDIRFLADNLDFVHSLIHSKIEDYDDFAFMCDFSELFKKLNNDNLETFINLVNIKGINQQLLHSCCDYLYSKENCEYVQNIIDKINSGEEDLIALPVYKYAQVNSRVDNARYDKMQEFGTDISDDEINKITKDGEVFAVGNNVYINENGNKTQLGLEKETYKRLFPPFKSLCVRQGNSTGDCYFLSGGLISFWKNNKAKANMLKTFSMDKNDIIVTIPGYKKYPVRFTDGKIKLGKRHADTSIGNLMLEQAYAKAKYCKNNRIKNTSFANPDKAMDFIYGGYEGDVYNEFLGANKAKSYINDDYKRDIEAKNYRPYMVFVKQNKMYGLLDKYSDMDKYLVCAGTKSREEGACSDYGISSNHAYAIENIDPENKTVTIINPYNSLYNAVISYEDFAKYFSSLSVSEV